MLRNQQDLQKCPLCGSPKSKLLDVKQSYQLFRCGSCGSNFQHRLSDIGKPYDESYFNENHQQSYGKSYIEDEENIRGFSKRRLKAIRKLNPEGKTLLDIGSAMGLFCDEAQKSGYRPTGAELSKYARDYSKSRFNIPCVEDFFSIEETFDCVTLWFTLEHAEIPSVWINKACNLLNSGGILAVSLPNGGGAFARFNRKAYFTARPVEHYIEPTLLGMKKLLENNRLTIRNTEIFGLHPERVGLPAWDCIKYLQKMTKLGDTFEIYAQK